MDKPNEMKTTEITEAPEIQEAREATNETKTTETKTVNQKNINSSSRKQQKKIMLYVVIGTFTLIWAGWWFSPTKPKNSKEANQIVNLTGVTSQFTAEVSKSALDEQQRQIKELNDRLTEISSKITEIQNSLAKKDETNSEAAALDNLQARIEVLENGITSKPTTLPESGAGAHNISNSNFSHEITTINFTYQDALKPEAIKTTKDYVPPGTFVRAVLLSGADTNAGVHGQTDTIPIVMRLLDHGTLPNGKRSRLKGCLVTAAAYGDASSERGQIRLQRLSCVRKDQTILDVAVEGTINDLGGSDGIRGQVVMRNNKIIWNAGFSGFLSGIGNALQQTVSKQSTTPLGIATSSIPSQKTFEYGAYGGANSALGKLADYYIKLADMYHPIVQIHAGSKVNVVFLKGFFLTDGSSAAGGINSALSNNNKDFAGERVRTSVQDAELGDPVTMESR